MAYESPWPGEMTDTGLKIPLATPLNILVAHFRWGRVTPEVLKIREAECASNGLEMNFHVLCF